MMSQLNAIDPELRDLARQAMGEGFTVYAEARPKRAADGSPIPLKFFHFSREVNGETRYGTAGLDYFGGGYVHMPITPSKAHGSCVVVAEYLSVPAMMYACRKTNGHVWDKTGREGVHENARPWGIPDVYDEVK